MAAFNPAFLPRTSSLKAMLRTSVSLPALAVLGFLPGPVPSSPVSDETLVSANRTIPSDL